MSKGILALLLFFALIYVIVKVVEAGAKFEQFEMRMREDRNEQ